MPNDQSSIWFREDENSRIIRSSDGNFQITCIGQDGDDDLFLTERVLRLLKLEEFGLSISPFESYEDFALFLRDLDRLELSAKKASPGNWTHHYPNQKVRAVCTWLPQESKSYDICFRPMKNGSDTQQGNHDMAYICDVCPRQILELISIIRTLLIAHGQPFTVPPPNKTPNKTSEKLSEETPDKTEDLLGRIAELEAENERLRRKCEQQRATLRDREKKLTTAIHTCPRAREVTQCPDPIRWRMPRCPESEWAWAFMKQVRETIGASHFPASEATSTAVVITKLREFIGRSEFDARRELADAREAYQANRLLPPGASVADLIITLLSENKNLRLNKLHVWESQALAQRLPGVIAAMGTSIEEARKVARAAAVKHLKEWFHDSLDDRMDLLEKDLERRPDPAAGTGIAVEGST